jgi:hypothetical protein
VEEKGSQEADLFTFTGTINLITVRILIQDSKSRKYLSADISWASLPEEGREFPTTTWAYDLAKHLLNGSFQIMLHFPESGELVHFDDGVGLAKRYQPA